MTWLISKRADLGIFFLPVWITLAICFILPQDVINAQISLAVWVGVVLLIDVGHVWSTIFITYFKKQAREKHSNAFLLIPLACFLISFVLYAFDSMWFWRILAYIAVFHFVKQQYGFFMLYSAKAKVFDQWGKYLIYWSTLVPIIYWHFYGNRNFEWFIPGDFLPINFLNEGMLIWQGIYWLPILIWIFKNSKSRVSIPMVLWLFTTALNWYVGIMYFNSDLVFTMTNVVGHGVAYVGLVWWRTSPSVPLQRGKLRSSLRSEKKKNSLLFAFSSKLPSLERGRGRGFTILLSIALLALLEEYLWDLLVNLDKQQFFGQFLPYFEFQTNHMLQAFFVALLTVPQFTHYILDGIIWKKNDKNPDLQNLMR